MVTWLSSGLVVNAFRLRADVSRVAGAANAMMLHWRQQRRRVRNTGITFDHDR